MGTTDNSRVGSFGNHHQRHVPSGNERKNRKEKTGRRNRDAARNRRRSPSNENRRHRHRRQASNSSSVSSPREVSRRKRKQRRRSSSYDSRSLEKRRHSRRARLRSTRSYSRSRSMYRVRDRRYDCRRHRHGHHYRNSPPRDRYYLDRYQQHEEDHHRHPANRERDRSDSSDEVRRRKRHRGRRKERDELYRRRRRRSRSLSCPSSSSSSSSEAFAPPARQRIPEPHVRAPPRAGVVSDDEEAMAATHGPYHSQAQAGGNGGSAAHHEINNSRQINTSRSGNNKHKKSKRDSAKSSSQNHDDTVGHFWGGPGTIVADNYRVECELGIGTFGRVIECLDLKKSGRVGGRCQRQQGGDDRHLVAIKMVRKVERYYESALIEADIVSDVNRRGGPRGRGQSHFAIMYDAFAWKGHYCLVFESLGPSLYDYLKLNNYKPFPMHYVRDFSRQLLEAIEFIHSFRLIHTDLKPENILVTKCPDISYGYQTLPESTKIKVIDFGGATYDNEKKSRVVNTRQYRAPEVILGCGWSMPSDLWSAGCILAELYQGELLFATHDNLEHLALMEWIIGQFPRRMLQQAKQLEPPLARQAFDSSGRHRMERVLPPENSSYVLSMPSLEAIVRDKKDEWFLNLLRSILTIDPERRASARDALRSCI